MCNYKRKILNNNEYNNNNT